MKLSPPARDIVTLIRRHRLNYDTLRLASHAARKHLGLREPKRGRRLPKLLPESSLKKYFQTVEESDNLQHVIMLKLLFYTGLRIAELCAIRVTDVDLMAGKVYIESGKGDKDRYVLFPESFRLLLRAHIETHPDNEYLFESSHKKHYTTRRVRQIVYEYGEKSGIPEHVHPHLFRHQILTWLKRQKLDDAQIQLISGHEKRETLEKYTHMALGDVKDDYESAVRKLEI